MFFHLWIKVPGQQWSYQGAFSDERVLSATQAWLAWSSANRLEGIYITPI